MFRFFDSFLNFFHNQTDDLQTITTRVQVIYRYVVIDEGHYEAITMSNYNNLKVLNVQDFLNLI